MLLVKIDNINDYKDVFFQISEVLKYFFSSWKFFQKQLLRDVLLKGLRKIHRKTPVLRVSFLMLQASAGDCFQ